MAQQIWDGMTLGQVESNAKQYVGLQYVLGSYSNRMRAEMNMNHNAWAHNICAHRATCW